MNKKICVRCSVENGEHFTYCRRCGALLPVVDRRPFAPPPPFKDMCDPITDPDTFQEEYEGVSRHDMGVYIGKNSELLLMKLDRMQATGASFSWCVPVFLLGLFFGLFGVAMWFFCRKLSRHGIVFTFAGVVAAFIGGSLSLSLPAILLGNFEQMNYMIVMTLSVSPLSFPSLMVYLMQFYPTFGIFMAICHLLVPSIAALSAVNIYKNKALSDIRQVNELYPDSRPLVRFALSRLGGRSFIPVIIPVVFLIMTITVSVVLITL